MHQHVPVQRAAQLLGVFGAGLSVGLVANTIARHADKPDPWTVELRRLAAETPVTRR